MGIAGSPISGLTITIASTLNFVGNNFFSGTNSFTATGAITQTAGKISSTGAGGLTLTSLAGGISLNQLGNAITTLGVVNANAGSFTLWSSGALTVSGTINASTISIDTNKPLVGVTPAATLLTIGAALTATTAITLTSGGALSLGANLDSGLATNLVTLTANGAITQTAAITVTGILALSSSTSNANITLNQTGNTITNLGIVTAGTGTYTLYNSGALTVSGAITASTISIDTNKPATGILLPALTTLTIGAALTATSTITLNSGGAVSLGGNLDSGAANSIIITAAGAITQAVGSTISTTGILALTTTNANITLNQDGNAITNLGAVSAGTGMITIFNNGGMTVSGTLNASTITIDATKRGTTAMAPATTTLTIGAAITATSASVTTAITLKSGGTLSLGANLNGGAANSVSITAAGAITQTATAITVIGKFSATTTVGGITLDNVANSIVSLGSLTAAGSIDFKTGAGLSLAGDLNSGLDTRTITLTAVGAITQSAATTIAVTGTLALSTTNANITLTQTGNAIAKLGIVTAGTGTFSLYNSGAMTVSGAITASTISIDTNKPVSGIPLPAMTTLTIGAAITATTAMTAITAITLTSGGALSLGGNLNSGAANSVTITAAGAITQPSGSGIIVTGTLVLTTTSGGISLTETTNLIAKLGAVSATVAAAQAVTIHLGTAAASVTDTITATGAISITSGGLLTVGKSGGLSLTSGGAISLTAVGMALTSAVTSSGGAVALALGTGNYSNGAAITNIWTTANENLSLTATSLNIFSGTTTVFTLGMGSFTANTPIKAVRLELGSYWYDATAAWSSSTDTSSGDQIDYDPNAVGTEWKFYSGTVGTKATNVAWMKFTSLTNGIIQKVVANAGYSQAGLFSTGGTITYEITIASATPSRVALNFNTNHAITFAGVGSDASRISGLTITNAISLSFSGINYFSGTVSFTATGAITQTAGSIDSSGTMSLSTNGGPITLNGAANVIPTLGAVTANGAITITTTGALSLVGNLNSGTTGAITISSGGLLTVGKASGLIIRSGAGAAIDLTAVGMTLSSAVTSSGGAVTMALGSGRYSNGANFIWTTTDKNLSLTAADLTMGSGTTTVFALGMGSFTGNTAVTAVTLAAGTYWYDATAAWSLSTDFSIGDEIDYDPNAAGIEWKFYSTTLGAKATNVAWMKATSLTNGVIKKYLENDGFSKTGLIVGAGGVVSYQSTTVGLTPSRVSLNFNINHDITFVGVGISGTPVTVPAITNATSLTFSGNNYFSGAVSFTASGAITQAAGSLISSGGALTLTSGGAINLNGAITSTAGALTITSGGALTGSGTISASDATNGIMTLNSGGTGAINLSGVITAGNSLVINSRGALDLSATGNQIAKLGAVKAKGAINIVNNSALSLNGNINSNWNFAGGGIDEFGTANAITIDLGTNVLSLASGNTSMTSSGGTLTLKLAKYVKSTIVWSLSDNDLVANFKDFDGYGDKTPVFSNVRMLSGTGLGSSGGNFARDTNKILYFTTDRGDQFQRSKAALLDIDSNAELYSWSDLSVGGGPGLSQTGTSVSFALSSGTSYGGRHIGFYRVKNGLLPKPLTTQLSVTVIGYNSFSGVFNLGSVNKVNLIQNATFVVNGSLSLPSTLSLDSDATIHAGSITATSGLTVFGANNGSLTIDGALTVSGSLTLNHNGNFIAQNSGNSLKTVTVDNMGGMISIATTGDLQLSVKNSGFITYTVGGNAMITGNFQGSSGTAGGLITLNNSSGFAVIGTTVGTGVTIGDSGSNLIAGTIDGQGGSTRISNGGYTILLGDTVVRGRGGVTIDSAIDSVSGGAAGLRIDAGRDGIVVLNKSLGALLAVANTPVNTSLGWIEINGREVKAPYPITLRIIGTSSTAPSPGNTGVGNILYNVPSPLPPTITNQLDGGVGKPTGKKWQLLSDLATPL